MPGHSRWITQEGVSIEGWEGYKEGGVAFSWVLKGGEELGQ